MKRLISTLLILAWVWAPVTTAGPSVVDSAGREVSLEQPAASIVALAPHTVENLFSAGAGEKLVGADSIGSAADHMAARKLLQQDIALRPDQAGDPSFDLKSFVRNHL